MAAHSQIARCDLAVPKKGPRLGICTAEAGPFPPHYGFQPVQVRNTPALPLIAQPLPCPLCRSVLGAKTHRPAVPSRVIQPASPGRWLFLVFWFRLFSPAKCFVDILVPMVVRTLRWPPFLPPFFGVSFCVGGFLCVLPICCTAVPPSLSSAKMSLARRQLNCCRRDASGSLACPAQGSVWVGVPPLCFF